MARGHCGLGRTVLFDVRGALPNGLTFVFFGGQRNVDLTPVGAPGNWQYADLGHVMVAITNSNGLDRRDVAVPNTAALLSTSTSVQAAVFDPSANAFGFVLSNALDLVTNN